MNKGINLLEQKTEDVISPILKKLELLRLVAISLLFLISAASVILFLFIFLSPLPALQKQEKEDLATLSEYHPDIAKLQLITDRLATSTVIIKKRNNFDKVLGVLQEMMPRDLTVTSITMKEKNLDVTVSSSSLASLETFVTNVVDSSNKKKNFSKITQTSFITDEKRKLFILAVSLKTI